MKHMLYTLICGAVILSGCNTSGNNELIDTIQPSSGEETPSDTITQLKVPLVQKGWYLRTTVTAIQADGTTLSHKTAGVFGELSESDAGKDKHDIPSYGAAALQVRFINEDLSPSEEYFSDYRHYDGTDKKESWTFIITNEYTTPPVNLANADLKINVEQMRDIFQKEGDPRYIEQIAKMEQDKRTKLTLIDLDNQQTYTYDELQTAGLKMDGKHTRTFRWVLGDPEPSDMTPPLISTLSASKVILSNNDSFTEKTVSATKFGTPPE